MNETENTNTPTPEPVFVSFKGDGNAVITGIPARHLTKADWDELSDDQRQHALASGLYEPANVQPAPVFEPLADEPQEQEAN